MDPEWIQPRLGDGFYEQRLVLDQITQLTGRRYLGNDVNLLAAQEQHDAEQDMQKKKKGFLSSKTTTTHDEWHDSTAVVTTLSGDSVQIALGNRQFHVI